MKMRKVVSAMLVAAMATGMVAGCGSSSDSKSDKKDAKGKVYYLNFKPEQDEQWQDLAKEYTKETGVDVTVLTAASGEYEKTLKSEMAKSNAPTLFQVNGPVGLASWKDYCYDLKDSDVAKQLTSDDFALMDGDKMSGIAYVIESYGIIYNKELLKKAGYSADDITNFDSFKKVVEDITANKDKLGFFRTSATERISFRISSVSGCSACSSCNSCERAAVNSNRSDTRRSLLFLYSSRVSTPAS